MKFYLNKIYIKLIKKEQEKEGDSPCIKILEFSFFNELRIFTVSNICIIKFVPRNFLQKKIDFDLIKQYHYQVDFQADVIGREYYIT